MTTCNKIVSAVAALAAVFFAVGCQSTDSKVAEPQSSVSTPIAQQMEANSHQARLIPAVVDESAAVEVAAPAVTVEAV